MRKSIITIALVCVALVALCSCSTVAGNAEAKSTSAPLYVAPVVPVTPANVAAAPVEKAVEKAVEVAGLTVNGAPFAGDPIMRTASGAAVVLEGKTTAAGDPIMRTTLQTAAGDPIMMDAQGNYYVLYGNGSNSRLVMIAAAGDPIMLYK